MIDAERRELTLASAGHPAPLIRHGGPEGRSHAEYVDVPAGPRWVWAAGPAPRLSRSVPVTPCCSSATGGGAPPTEPERRPRQSRRRRGQGRQW
ncbi:hypothetical protein NKG94_19255 [Micromonospora sp. M12]